MSRSEVFAALSVLTALAFQVWVTFKVRRSAEYDDDQKGLQTKLIWLVPVLGAAIVFSGLEPDAKQPPKPPTDSSQR
ncbi:MAG: hypothetical protein RJA70_3309 [Pseudomonadota bacterium]|jgi:hypothetical protein